MYSAHRHLINTSLLNTVLPNQRMFAFANISNSDLAAGTVRTYNICQSGKSKNTSAKSWSRIKMEMLETNGNITIQ